MKYILFFSAVTLFSCSKESNTPAPPIENSSVQYKVNGNLVVMNNVNVLSGQYVTFLKQLKGSFVPQTRYLFNGQKGANDLLIFHIVADSLRQASYHFDSTSNDMTTLIMTFNANESVLFYGGDYFDIDISSYKDGHISGTFAAKISPVATLGDYTTRNSTVITEGKINNVQVIY